SRSPTEKASSTPAEKPSPNPLARAGSPGITSMPAAPAGHPVERRTSPAHARCAGWVRAPTASRDLTAHVDAQVPDDELLPVRRVLSHVEGEQLLRPLAFLELDRIEAHVGTDHELELVRRDLAETLEAGDFGGLSEFRQRLLLLRLVVAI